MLRQKRVTVLVIPEAGGRTYECKIPQVALIGAMLAAALVGVLLLMGAWYYVQFRTSAARVARLQRERALLAEEVERIDELERLLARLEQSNEQLRTILGESGTAAAEPERVRGQARYESFVAPVDRLRWGHLRTFPGLWPADGPVLQPFRLRAGGLLIAVPAGRLVRAAGAGQVVRAGYDEQLGHVMHVDHGGGLVTVYAHLRRLLLEDGAYVEKGQPLALTGRSGEAGVPCLYYAVRANGRPLDPEMFRLWL